MKTKFFSMVFGAMMLAVASVGVTASATEAEDMPDTTNAVVEEITENESIEETSENVTSTEKPDNSTDEIEKYREIMSNLANAEVTEVTADYENDPYYDTDGNATLIKSEKIVYNSEEMQFIAVATKDGHVFYVLINYSAENDEDQVFFLNKVDDYDLYALLYAGAESDDESENITPEQAFEAAQAANGRVQVDSATDVTETEDSTDETAEDGQVTAQPSNMNSIYFLLGAVVLIGAGAAGFFFMKKKNGSKTAVKETVEDEDEEDITFPDDEEY
ncbi:MAG: DUF4366 domain-containing protein [Ruminococcus sp.]|nr:DUF4366 domain-containing protein [Ruminococcus sp.]